MDIIWYNAGWMSYNLLLAIVAWGLAYVGFARKQSLGVSLMIWLLWLLFLPNTAYVLTDIQHFWGQIIALPTDLWFWLVIEYMILYAVGIVAYFGSMYLFERYISRMKWLKKSQSMRVVIMCGLNLLVGIGVVMGRVQRTNSWDLFTQPMRTVNDLIVVVSTTDTIAYVTLFWILTTALYFLLKRLALKKNRI